VLAAWSFSKCLFSRKQDPVVKEEGCKTGIAINMGLVVKFCNTVYVTETQRIRSWKINFSLIVSIKVS
jgi:hypothetical protein